MRRVPPGRASAQDPPPVCDGWPPGPPSNSSHDTCRPSAATAQIIRTKVDALSKAKAPKVDESVRLGGPDHGTGTAILCFQTSCGAPRVGSSFPTALDSRAALSGAAHTQTAWGGHGGATVDGQVREVVR